MKAQATRINPKHEELLEIIGCSLFFMLDISAIIFLYTFPWERLI